MPPQPLLSERAPSSSVLGEILGIGQLEDFARRLGALLTPSGQRQWSSRTHRHDLRANERALRRIYVLLSEDVQQGELPTAATEWLLDNYHVVSAAFRDVRQDLPPGFFKRLPIVHDERGPRSRVYVMARELIGRSAGALDAERMKRFVAAFQSVAPLSIAELWAWPSALKIALLEYLGQHAEVLAQERRQRTAADLVAIDLDAPAQKQAWPSPIEPAFVIRILQRTREQGEGAGVLRQLLDEALEANGLSVEDVIRAEGRHQASEQTAMANLVGSLRLIGSFDWSEFFEAVNLVEQVLRRDPAGTYAQMDFQSRDSYRHAIEEVSEPTGEAQVRIALKAVELARQQAERDAQSREAHVGHYLIGNGRLAFERSIKRSPRIRFRVRRAVLRHATLVYLGTIALGTLGLLALTLRYALDQGASTTALPWIALLGLIPASELTIQVFQRLIANVIPPRRLPRLELRSIPASARTMVIVPTIFDSVERVQDLLAHLEVQALGNLDDHLHFALLSDFPDATDEHRADDEAILTAAITGINELNARHASDSGDRFLLCHRPRLWNEREGLWMGWERKRGKIEEFNRFLRGATDTSIQLCAGNAPSLASVRYCITLDSDTRLPRDAARQLVGIILHPLHHARVDPSLRRVVDGYGILQPRISVTFSSAAGSLFARVYAGHTGVDPYTTAVSDTYQDLFGEGIFAGKGLYDVDVFIEALNDRVPENALLSHDLFEGLHARVALVTDVELVDEYPSSVLSHARRQHRWIRGDWQILFWLFPWVPSRHAVLRNRLSVIGRWKILDNLRRSLVSPALLLAFVAGWTVFPGSPLLWTALNVLVVSSHLLPIFARLLVGPRRAQSYPVFWRNLVEDTSTSLTQAALSVTFLAYQAWQTVHAIGLTLVRLGLTKRRLLEWETAAATAAKASGLIGRRGLERFFSDMVVSPFAAAVIFSVVGGARPSALPVATPFLVLWALAPGIAYWLSRPAPTLQRQLNASERLQLRRMARLTWRYFEQFVTGDESWLPPDNYQEVGREEKLARRTSPTNVGLGLLSTLAAHDLGYLTTAALVARLDGTLSTLERLPRHNGHFLNWYDTTTLEPLYPRYVSTVDSGNLAASLMTLAQGLRALENGPERPWRLLTGLQDTSAVLRSVASHVGEESQWSQETRNGIAKAARDITREARRALEEGTSPSLAGLDTPLVAALAENQPLDPDSDLAFWTQAVLDAVAALGVPSQVPATALQDLSRRASTLADEMRFDFLYDRRRRLFAIGYRLTDLEGSGRLDPAFYDMLASEARLTSFVAIAKGDVPQHHWFHLGRLVTNVRGQAALISWGGTMFEYLMPMLLTRSFPGTLLDQSCRASVTRQMDYGRRLRSPWGISESAYDFTDRAGNYQYKAFGVPGLGLKRGLEEDLVVSPYSSALATLIDPDGAAANLKRLARAGAEGPFGFYEAVDYTRRAPAGDASPSSAPTIVRAYFAHHHGMSLVALANVLADDIFVTRFHGDPRIQATELLLQERVPREAIVSEPRPAEAGPSRPSVVVPAIRRFLSPHTTSPHTQFLSNGRYTVAATHTGGGYSMWRELSVTRRREDRTCDVGSQFIYLRDPWSGTTWAPTYQPVCREPDSYEATFSIDQVSVRSRHGDIETHLKIAVSPDVDVEVRRLTIHNRGDRAREIEITTYAEIVLGRPEDDLAHPAFGKLFVETEYDPQSSGLLFSRRPRTHDEPQLWAFHVLGVEGRTGGSSEWETDRARFLGPGGSTSRPAALSGRPLSGTVGAVLDPVGAIRERVRVPAGGSVRVTVSTGIAPDRETALALARSYRDAGTAVRAFSMAFTHAHTTLLHVGLTSDHAILYDRVASRVFGTDDSCISPSDIALNTLGQPDLWSYGISGDIPILLVRVGDVAGLRLVRQLLYAQDYWRLKGLNADLVILNEHPSDYLDSIQRSLLELVGDPRWAGRHGKPGGSFLLRAEGMPESHCRLLRAVARAVMTDDLGGELARQLDRPAPWTGPYPPPPVDSLRRPPVSQARVDLPLPELVMANGFGGFTKDGREYVVALEQGDRPPLPWSNVLANETFGTMVSSSGSAFTWAVNSRENRLTSFANDPIGDPTTEAIYLRDDDTGQSWGATPAPWQGGPTAGRWLVRHRAGVTRYQHAMPGLEQELAVFVAPTDPVKLSLLTITNTGSTPRRLSVFGYVEWCLGPPRRGERRFVTTEADARTRTLFARNSYNGEFRKHVAFFSATELVRSWTCDRTEFIGRNRSLMAPAALGRDVLLQRAGAGLDPCAALQTSIVIEPGQTQTVGFVLGQAPDHEEAAALARRFSSATEQRATLVAAERYWDDTLDAIKVQTPDDSFDLIVNRWLLYQTLACRIWARSGPSQPGGAYGFRDQLQDVLALLHSRPEIARAQLLRAASRQFVEGDVQHWWHPPSGRGTRTRCSDDLLWLPYAIVEYVHVTGDTAILQEVVSFIDSPPLEPGQLETYDLPLPSNESASLFEHAVRAIERSLRYGAHGLPFIGSGDWNDGMNEVGREGRGESVWLGWFLVTVLNGFADVCRLSNDLHRAERYRREARGLTDMLELAWDGDWYRRAYFDDGTPLGSAQNEECRIDSITQSWAILSGAADRRKADRAMQAVRNNLVRRDAQLVLLLTPPFDRMTPEPGYIKGYLPGVRENGGQYTHAALWSVMALTQMGQGDEAMELFHMINPINHARSREGVDRYRVEPYVVAADVYAHPSHVGRGGWTWYTGSAGWMYRAAVEGCLGLKRSGSTFSVNPCIPASWPGFKIDWKFGRTRYHISVVNPDRRCTGVKVVELDGARVQHRAIPLEDDGSEHHLTVVLGEAQSVTLPTRAARIVG